MLSKETVIDLIQVTETGAVQVRRATYILEDGARISQPTYERVAYTQEGGIPDTEHDNVKAHAAVAWGVDVK